MVDVTGGPRRKTRTKLRKIARTRGKLQITRILRKFEVGDAVHIDIESSVHKGMPHPKFQGKHGKIVKKLGNSYYVEIKDGNCKKQLISAAVHLKK